MKLIGLSGISGSGKTYLINLLKQKLGDRLSIISSDNYYKSIEFQNLDANGFHNFDLPEGINEQAFLNDIIELSNGQTLIRKVYNFNNPNAKKQFIEIKSAPLLIVEGLFIYHYQAIADLLEYKIFIDIDSETALKRRIERDEKERGMTKETVEYQWSQHVMPGYEAYVRPHFDKANLIISNQHNSDDAFKKLEISLNQLLNKVKE
ncbi:MAG: uridine kinase [bacterium]|nr:uridine kinase [bacterium]